MNQHVEPFVYAQTMHTRTDATAVWIFQPFERVLVYHLPAWLYETDHGGFRRRDDGGEEYLVACGLSWGRVTGSGNQTDRAQMMRRDHAEIVGRLCENCDRVERRARGAT